MEALWKKLRDVILYRRDQVIITFARHWLSLVHVLNLTGGFLVYIEK